MILEDAIFEQTSPLFIKCEALATRKDGFHLDYDKGAYTLMATLFSDCLCHQFNELFKDGKKYYINHEDVLFHSLKANK